MKSLLVLPLAFVATAASAHLSFPQNEKPQVVISDLDKLQAVNAFILSRDEKNNLGVAQVSPAQMSRISNVTHFQGKCAGFEVLDSDEVSRAGIVLNDLVTETLRAQTASPIQLPDVQFNQSYKDLSELADAASLKLDIEWLSSYPTRYNKAPEPNAHVIALQNKLNTLLKDAPWSYEVSLVDHVATKQKSVKLTIPGRLRPNEIVILGAHLDSINQSYFGSDLAPGADDNASGSSNLIAAVKILMKSSQPERTIEFFWYAGEESGLLGSSEIAKDYKAKNKNVIGVLQLDMTLYPGNGEQVIGLVSDYTSPWLNEILTKIYSVYLNASFVPDTCGYACSDHASWHRQGFPAATPFESTTSTMNGSIHTEKDKLSTKSSINHSNTFTKLAVLFGLVLGNSELKQN